MLQVLPIDLPYEYISILNVDKVTKNSTFTCKAVNTKGTSVASIELIVTTFLNILTRPVGKL